MAIRNTKVLRICNRANGRQGDLGEVLFPVGCAVMRACILVYSTGPGASVLFILSLSLSFSLSFSFHPFPLVLFVSLISFLSLLYIPWSGILDKTPLRPIPPRTLFPVEVSLRSCRSSLTMMMASTMMSTLHSMFLYFFFLHSLLVMFLSWKLSRASPPPSPANPRKRTAQDIHHH